MTTADFHPLPLPDPLPQLSGPALWWRDLVDLAAVTGLILWVIAAVVLAAMGGAWFALECLF